MTSGSATTSRLLKGKKRPQRRTRYTDTEDPEDQVTLLDPEQRDHTFGDDDGIGQEDGNSIALEEAPQVSCIMPKTHCLLTKVEYAISPKLNLAHCAE